MKTDRPPDHKSGRIYRQLSNEVLTIARRRHRITSFDLDLPRSRANSILHYLKSRGKLRLVKAGHPGHHRSKPAIFALA